MHDGRHSASWDSDPGTHAGTLKIGAWQHVALIVDEGPRIISFVVDGISNDGGAGVLGDIEVQHTGRLKTRESARPAS